MVVYRDVLVPPSEGFILQQGEALRRYQAIYAGCRLGDLKPPPERTVLVTDGCRPAVVAAAAWKWLGFAPNLVRRVGASPSLVHAHFGVDAVRALPLAQRLNVPLVATFHGYDATTSDSAAMAGGLGMRRLVSRRRQLIETAAGFVAVSSHIKREMVDKGYPAEAIRVINLGVDVQYFSPRSEVGTLAIDAPLVLFVGRLVEVKGAAYAIRAMARVQEEIPDARLVILGDGPLRGDLARLADALSVDCEFRGMQSRSQVRQWLRRCHLICVPSVRSREGRTEGFGLAPLEAAACGVPAVGFQSGGLSEAIVDRHTGLLCAPGDVEALAGNVIALLGDAEYRQRLGRQALERARAEHDAALQVLKLERFYDDVIARTR